MISWVLFWLLTFVGTTTILGWMHHRWEKERLVREYWEKRRKEPDVVLVTTAPKLRVLNGRTITPKRVPAWDASGNIPTIVYIPTPPAVPPCL